MPATLLSRHVATFLQCARSRSFTRAAAQLSISPTALIAQLDLFEARLGFKLFEHMQAATAGFQVGYISEQHFSRDYKRFFGLPPLQDIART